jgi:hypothetical protein
MVRASTKNSICGKCNSTLIGKLNKGKTAWNKGLTKETDDRVMKYSIAITGVPKNFNSDQLDFLRKNARKQQKYMTYLKRGGLTDDEYLQRLPDVKKYRRIVRLMTSKVDTSSLENYRKDGYDLDHKFSVQEGFNRNIPPYIIANISNLQYIPSNINRSKGIKCAITQEELFNQI